MMKTVSIPGATLCPTSWGLMILKYGESVWVTLTRRATYKVKKNTPQYLSLSLISYSVQFNQHLLKQTLHYTADIKSNPNQFKLCVNLIFPKVESPHSTKKVSPAQLQISPNLLHPMSLLQIFMEYSYFSLRGSYTGYQFFLSVSEY